MNELLTPFAAFAATYLLHSTFFLLACWTLMRLVGEGSHFLTERMWKLGAVLGLVTAGLQVVSAPLAWEFLAPPSIVANPAIPSSAPFEHRPLDAAVDDFEPESRGKAIDASVVLGEGDAIFDPNGALAGTDATASSELSEFPSWAGDGVAWERSTNGSPAWDWQSQNAFGARAGQEVFEESKASSDAAFGSELGEPMRTSAESTARVDSLFTPLIRLTATSLLTLVLLGAFILCWQAWRLTRCFATSRELTSGTARRTLDRFLRRNGIGRDIRLLESTASAEPLTFGLWRWTIVLPSGAEDRLARDELKALFAHEVAHLVRGDVWWLWVGRVLCTCLAFQPLNLLARRKWQQAAEYLCDDWAVERGIGPISLARCLTHIAEWRLGGSACKVGLAAAGTKATLVQRVERLVEEDRRGDVWDQPLRRKLITIAAASAALGLAGFAPRIVIPAAAPQVAGVDSPTRFNGGLAATREWRELQEELLQLNADLERLEALTPPVSRQALSTSFDDIQRRADMLHARRETITSLLEKDSQR